jgi:diguanylate cyclase (GGDEF)-like protein
MVYIDSAHKEVIQMTRKRALRSGSPLSLVCFSLDDFQSFRRQFGFDLGDQVLKHVETVASEVLEPIHIVRLEDDHFVALLGSEAQDALDRSDRLRTRVGASKLRFTVDGSQVAHSITISLGIAHNTSNLPSPEAFVTQGVQAWGVARERGDTVSAYEETPEAGTGSLLDTLSQSIDTAGAGTQVSIIQLDIDGFGALNETVGALLADQTLEWLTSNLVEHFGEDGFTGRLWSDEFLVVLPNVRAEDAAYRAEDARRKISEIESPSGKLSLSLGVATFPNHATDTGELIRKAREARFVSRQGGGARTSVARADQMVTKTSHFSKTQLKRLSMLAKSQDRSEAAILREGLDVLLQIYQDGAPNALILGHPFE